MGTYATVLPLITTDRCCGAHPVIGDAHLLSSKHFSHECCRKGDEDPSCARKAFHDSAGMDEMDGWTLNSIAVFSSVEGSEACESSPAGKAVECSCKKVRFVSEIPLPSGNIKATQRLGRSRRKAIVRRDPPERHRKLEARK